MAGVAGSGQKELCEAIAGLHEGQQGRHPLQKGKYHRKDPAEIIDLGISMSFMPEDRLGMGLVASMGMVDNMLLKSYRSHKGPFIDKNRPAPCRRNWWTGWTSRRLR